MKNYSKLGLFKSRGRLNYEPKNIYRTPFQRDRDRIIHSASFRRLKHKTQVFVNTEGDHYRTRITHSIEVAQIARTIAKYLNLNDDLAETLSLAHDLGHTPFGHAGEYALHDCMKNYGGFDHNLQTLRIVMFLENKYLKFQGLNLTIETLDGLLKHNGPYGYEGQGPEHSSARPQRLLSLCSEDNMVVANLTTPANLFHLIRRQLAWEFRKPCFLLSPKSLLRHPSVISNFDDFTNSQFQEIIDDNVKSKKLIKRVILCTGKFYYDLDEYRQGNNIKDVAIVRIEQLSPFPKSKIEKILNTYSNAKKIIWAQEENQNMGYWSYISSFNLKNIELFSRKRSSSPSTGFLKVHLKEQDELIKKIFN